MADYDGIFNMHRYSSLVMWCEDCGKMVGLEEIVITGFGPLCEDCWYDIVCEDNND